MSIHGVDKIYLVVSLEYSAENHRQTYFINQNELIMELKMV